jgi:hypothetical protein
LCAFSKASSKPWNKNIKRWNILRGRIFHLHRRNEATNLLR